MIGILGDTLLMVALSMAVVQALLPFVAKWKNEPRLHVFGLLACGVQLICVGGAFLLLILAYVRSDFSLLNVLLNSHTQKPLIFKISGAWGNHEGSMLLWALILSFFGFVAARLAGDIRPYLLGALGLIAIGLLLFILCTSSPFTMVEPVPVEGQGLNPILQDIGLAMHPPMLYLGYVGFGIAFAYAIAGMWYRRVDADWAQAVHPWICVSWGLLTFGIGLGSWWAYRELGWGGWWFWDPVENVSLLPWLTGTALMHANRVLMRRGEAVHWTLLLAILTFAMSLIGTFIVRSGIIISVHSFASDPGRGMFILLYISLIVGAALWLFTHFASRKTPAPSDQTPAEKEQNGVSRTGLILVGNIFLVTAALTILIAILYPLGMQLASLPTVSVGPPYFNQTVLPLMVPAVILAAIAPFIWGSHARWQEMRRQLAPSILAAVTAAIVALTCIDHEPVLTAIGAALAAWLFLGVLSLLYSVWKHKKQWPRHGWAMLCGHLGLALFVLCLTASGLHKQTENAVIALHDTVQLSGYSATFSDQKMGMRENYAYRRATVNLANTAGRIHTLEPELRFYPERQMQTVEASIASNPLRDIYLTSGLQPETDKLMFTLYVNPAMQGLWLAFALVGTGGLIAAFSGGSNRT